MAVVSSQLASELRAVIVLKAELVPLLIESQALFACSVPKCGVRMVFGLRCEIGEVTGCSALDRDYMVERGVRSRLQLQIRTARGERQVPLSAISDDSPSSGEIDEWCSQFRTLEQISARVDSMAAASSRLRLLGGATDAEKHELLAKNSGLLASLGMGPGGERERERERERDRERGGGLDRSGSGHGGLSYAELLGQGRQEKPTRVPLKKRPGGGPAGTTGHPRPPPPPAARPSALSSRTPPPPSAPRARPERAPASAPAPAPPPEQPAGPAAPAVPGALAVGAAGMALPAALPLPLAFSPSLCFAPLKLEEPALCSTSLASAASAGPDARPPKRPADDPPGPRRPRRPAAPPKEGQPRLRDIVRKLCLRHDSFNANRQRFLHGTQTKDVRTEQWIDIAKALGLDLAALLPTLAFQSDRETLRRALAREAYGSSPGASAGPSAGPSPPSSTASSPTPFDSAPRGFRPSRSASAAAAAVGPASGGVSPYPSGGAAPPPPRPPSPSSSAGGTPSGVPRRAPAGQATFHSRTGRRISAWEASRNALYAAITNTPEYTQNRFKFVKQGSNGLSGMGKRQVLLVAEQLGIPLADYAPFAPSDGIIPPENPAPGVPPSASPPPASRSDDGGPPPLHAARVAAAAGGGAGRGGGEGDGEGGAGPRGGAAGRRGGGGGGGPGAHPLLELVLASLEEEEEAEGAGAPGAEAGALRGAPGPLGEAARALVEEGEAGAGARVLEGLSGADLAALAARLAAARAAVDERLAARRRERAAQRALAALHP
eukprot:tig00021318_g20184.t1